MDLKQANRSQCERSLSAASSYTPPGKADFIQVHTTSSSYGSSEVAIDTKSEKSETPSRRWKTTLIRFGPLSGIFCMCLAVLSIVASLGILIGSDGNSIEKWETPPSTYIAIFTAVGNLSMRYAAVQGTHCTYPMQCNKTDLSILQVLSSLGGAGQCEALVSRECIMIGGQGRAYAEHSWQGARWGSLV